MRKRKLETGLTHPLQRSLIVLMALALVGIVRPLSAEDAPADWNFKSAKANDAVRKYQAARKKLDEAYAKNRTENRDSLIEKLQEQVKAATKANDLDGALALRDAINLLRGAGQPAVAKVEESQPAEEGDYLDDLPEGPFKVRGVLGKHGHNQLGAAVTVKGAAVQHALCTHPDPNSTAFVSYGLQGKYQTFSGSVAIADYDIARANADDHTVVRTPLTFRIYGDKRLLWTSKPVVLPGASQPFNVGVRHVKVLYLRVDCPGAHGYRFAMWVDPMLKK